MWRGIQGIAELPEGKAANTSVTAKRLGVYLAPYWRSFVGITFLSIIIDLCSFVFKFNFTNINNYK
jgi:hypothetical protein